MKSWINTGKFWSWLGLLALLLIWESGVRLANTPHWILPPPSTVGIALVKILPLIKVHAGYTVLEALLGFIISILLAILLALLFSLSPLVKRLFYPLLIVSQTIPLIILAILFTIWFGWGLLPKVLVVILVCFFPVSLSLINGINSVDLDQINLFRSMGASPMTVFRLVELPLALPSLFAGLRISATYSIMAAVIAEWIGAQHGLGYFMTLQQKSFAIDRVLAAATVICLLSLLLVKLVDGAEYWLVPWNREHKRLALWN